MTFKEVSNYFPITTRFTKNSNYIILDFFILQLPLLSELLLIWTNIIYSPTLWGRSYFDIQIAYEEIEAHMLNIPCKQEAAWVFGGQQPGSLSHASNYIAMGILSLLYFSFIHLFDELIEIIFWGKIIL